MQWLRANMGDVTSSERIKIAYDGNAVRNGTMDVREFAPALLGIGDLCREANRVLNGDRAEISVLVKSDFQRGSFEVSLDVVQSLASQLTALGTDPLSAHDILRCIGFAASVNASDILCLGKNLLEFIKALRGARPRQVGTTVRDGSTLIVFEGDATNINIELSPKVAQLAVDDSVREAAYRVVRPLERPGIDVFESRDGRNNVVERVEKSDLPSFVVRHLETAEVRPRIEQRTAVLQIIRVWFEGTRNKWTFSDGNARFNARIDDAAFLARFDDGEIQIARGRRQFMLADITITTTGMSRSLLILRGDGSSVASCLRGFLPHVERL